MKKIYLAIAIALSTLTANGNVINGFHSNRPAMKWEEYLVSGNGTMGLMVAGNPNNEELVVNHTNLFMPIHEPLIPPSQGNNLQRIRQMLNNGEYKDASELLVKISHTDGFGKKRQSDLFVPAFQINLTSDSLATTDYRRSVDFMSGELKVEWTNKRGSFMRRSFVSRTDNIIITEIKALPKSGKSKSGKLDFKIDLQTINRFDPKRKIKFCLNDSLNIKKVEKDVTTQGIAVQVWFSAPWKGGYQGYNGLIRIKNDGGKVVVKDGNIIVKGAKNVMLLCEVAPAKDMSILPSSVFANHIDSLIVKDYDTLLKPHRQWQAEMMLRVGLDLGADSASRSLSSEELLKLGGAHPAVIEHLFSASRYNILSATGTNPPNLQGIWGATMTPPWAGDYTTNGNLPTAVSHYLQASTPELMLSLFNKLESQMDDYRLNARVLFGCKGIHIPSHIQLHGLDNQFDATWPMTFWTAGAAWYSLFYYDYYLYTQDEQFLNERAIPFMLEAVQFYEEFLTETDEKGKYVFNPSYSPENHPKNSRPQACINATMDIAVCKALLRDLIALSDKGKVDTKRAERWKQMLSMMPDYEVSEEGDFREWLWKDLQDNHEHRHASHLIGLYYRRDPEIMKSKTLQEGVVNTICRRLDYRETSSGVMAFGVSQLAFPACNLRQGELTGKMLTLAGNTYYNNNLMTTHDPHEIFNTDMSGAYPAIIMQMLAYSDEGGIELLPAIPSSWNKGKIQGMSLRGGIRLEEMEWNADMCKATLVSMKNQTIEISVSKGSSQTIKLIAGKPTSINIKR
ncbi:MAG: glycoside hydrolase N-terminal domain-containing protein [Prevotella sp.]|nr:glycoside hydrolase N-terminal domain-containing protein [Prevotella sp.]